MRVVSCVHHLLSRAPSGDAAIKRTATRILSVWEERNVFSAELRQMLHNLLGQFMSCVMLQSLGVM